MKKNTKVLSSLEKNFLILLSDIKPLIKPVVSNPNRWFLNNKNEQLVKTVKNYSFNFDHKAIKNKKSYLKCQEAFKKDSTFKQATKLASYWGRFDTILNAIINESVQVKRGKIFVDEVRARQKIKELNSVFAQKNLNIDVHAHLLGVIIKRKRIEFPNGLYLYRLNKNEINSRQPLIEAYHTNALWTDPQITFHPTELRYSTQVAVDQSKQFAFFEAANYARLEAHTAFRNLIESLLLVKKGDVQLGPIYMEGGSIQHGISYNMNTGLIPSPKVVISNAEAKQILKAYELLSIDGKEKDKVLSGALQRFFIGRQRQNLVDKLIDYVISWEAILLTQKGSSIKQELSYRFSINGSSLLTYVLKEKDRKKLFKKMKYAYAIRSKIVHGGSDMEINKILESGNFLDLNDACNYLEDSFKKTIWWLINVDTSDRPYYKINGWEDLLWIN